MQGFFCDLIAHILNKLSLFAINCKGCILGSLLPLHCSQFIHILSILLCLLPDAIAIEQHTEELCSRLDIHANLLKARPYNQYCFLRKLNTPLHLFFLTFTSFQVFTYCMQHTA